MDGRTGVTARGSTAHGALPMRAGMAASRRNRAIGALAEVAVRVGAGGGFMLGLFAALQGHPRAAACPKDGLCVGEQISAAVWGIFGPAFAGAFAGLAASLLVVLLLRRLRTRPAAPSAAPAPAPQARGRWIRARYPGRCRSCAAVVAPGDRVRHDPQARAVTCADCAV
jgi:hypothetical protein